MNTHERRASRPLNSIGLPYYDSEMLSAWSPLFISGTTEYLPSPKVPLQITNTMKYNEGIAYAALPKELRGRRNVVNSGRKKVNGRFRSGKTHSTEVCPSISFLSSTNFYSWSQIQFSMMTQWLSHVITAVSKSNIPSLESRTLISGKLIASKARHYFSFSSL